jgi:hypothetical protein
MMLACTRDSDCVLFGLLALEGEMGAQGKVGVIDLGITMRIILK